MTEGQENPVQQLVSPSPSRLDGIADKIALVVVIGLIACVIIALSFTFAWYFAHVTNNQVQPIQVVTQPTPVPTIVPIQTPEPLTTPTLPTALTFTVLAANAAQYGGTTPITQHYTLQTTTGSVLVLPNYTSWNRLFPGVKYKCVITGVLEGYSDVYTVDSCEGYQNQGISNSEHFIYYEYEPNGYIADQFQYYYWNKQYWNDDGKIATPIEIVHLPLHAPVISGRPPDYQYPY